MLQRYRNDGFSEREAKRKTNSHFFPKNRKLVMDSYLKCLVFYEKLKRNKVHHKIMATVKRLQEDGYGLEESLKYALKKRQYVFDTLLDACNVDGEEEDGSEDSEDEEEMMWDSDEENSSDEKMISVIPSGPEKKKPKNGCVYK